MPNITLIILIAAVVLTLGFLLIRRISDNAGSIALVLGVAITAAIVTGLQIANYRQQQQQAASEYADSSQAQTAAINNMPPPPTAPIIAPAMPPTPPLMRGPTGGAAPAAVRNPYSPS